MNNIYDSMKRKARLSVVTAICTVAIPVAVFVYCAGVLYSSAGGTAIIITLAAVTGVFVFCALYNILTLLVPLTKLINLLKCMNENDLLGNKANGDDIILMMDNLGWLGKMVRKLACDINIEPRARLLGAEVALYALQSQINPHFLYNTLDTIRNYAINRDVPEVADMTQSLASIFRYSISRPGEVATLADEVKNVKAYLKIQWYRFSDRFHTVWEIDDEGDDILKYSLPVLTLQPLVENAIQHGLEDSLETGIITIRATTTLSKMIISVEDNGRGIPESKLQEIRKSLEETEYVMEKVSQRNPGKKSGISLQNVSQRLKLYFGDAGNLSISSIEGYGTTVEIVVPKI
ncbi:sensor histidine kinase [Christensenella intestinihominis]|uniref:sensor histidine kinase n=1 Tax=Christensenella intestinihominis TaxID=1851429 RepID=UPI00082AA95E|nr:sensor histidine kinase [Christensenella intestinihominis]